MLILAVDTCDARGSVAILRDDAVLCVFPHDSVEDYSSWLLPAVDHVLASSGTKLPDVELFAVAAGPGSFTGLRVGLTAAKAWGEVYHRPVCALSRLEALAEQIHGGGQLVAVFVGAKRDQVFGGLYRRTERGLVLVGEEAVMSPQGFLDYVSNQTGEEPVAWVSLDPDLLTCDPAWQARQARGESVVLAQPMLAPAIGRIALRRAHEGRLLDPLGVDANYIRRSDAEIFWKGEAASVTHGK